MKVIEKGKYRFEFYDSIMNMPARNSDAFHSKFISDSSIGNSINDIGARYQSLAVFLKHKKIDEATEELRNLTMSYNNAIEKINTKSRCIACAVSKINDQHFEDVSDETISYISDKIVEAGITNDQIEFIRDDIKKNFMQI